MLLISRFIKQAGAIACLVVCGACAQVALMSVTPIVAALARQVDQRTGREIVELEQKQDWPGMLALARTQLQREPVRADWWVLQGYALARQRQYAAAVESYQQAVRISPEDEDARLALGASLAELGQFEQAIQMYRKALGNRPESAPAYFALAELYRKRGQPDLALPNYREGVRYEPDSEQAWAGLAIAYHLTGQIERRDQALQSLRRINPDAADQLEKQHRLK